MTLRNSVIAVFSALSAMGTLARPLEMDATGNSQTQGQTCPASQTATFAKLSGKNICIPFNSPIDQVGISWTDLSGTYASFTLTAFSDNACKNQVVYITAPEWDSGLDLPFCVSQKDNGGSWGSVRYNDYTNIHDDWEAVYGATGPPR